MFSNKDLRNLIFPLFIEQFLLMFVGIADTFVVSFSSEADVSGVSLVTSFNTVMIFLFTALSAGGAVIISQYIGCDDKKMASRAAGQLLTISTLFSVVLTVLILLFREPLLRLLFGKIEPDVMAACESYLFITTLSLPALAVYDAGAALCRSIGKTNVTMYISLVTNIINVVGNCVGVFGLHLGAAGVAWPSLISRTLSAVAVTVFCFQNTNAVQYHGPDILAWDGGMQKRIMGIALPNGLENGVHQLVKVALSSMDSSSSTLKGWFLNGNSSARGICCTCSHFSSCRDSSVEKMSSAAFSDTFKLLFGIGQHLLRQRLIGFRYFTLWVIGENAFAGRADFSSTDRAWNGWLKYLDFSAIGLADQITDLLVVSGAAVCHGQQDALDF